MATAWIPPEMVLRGLLSLFGGNSDGRPRGGDAAPRLKLDRQPDRIYAIGDVHGCLDLLKRIEAQIVADAEDVPGSKLIVMLGDLIDRGPASAQVIDHMLAGPPAGFERICLRGNHEAMMLAFIRDPKRGAIWLENGGREAMLSYGLPSDTLLRGVAPRVLQNLIASHVPDEHIEFLEHLPVMLETPEALFVHAGLRQGVKLEAQTDDDLIWFRDNYESDYAEFGRPVVHGHMPRTEALVTPFRLAIDTGVYVNGRLTAVRIMPGAAPVLFAASREIPGRHTAP
jgi:serine/threonine protein phosphatase 1